MALLAIVFGISLAACSRTGAPPNNQPDFAGTVEPVPAQSCSSLLPEGMHNPFGGGAESTVSSYSIVRCWHGALQGQQFLLNEYFSPSLGGGVAVKYAGNVVAHLPMGGGPPTIVRFTSDVVCFAEKAGAYFVAVDLRTGSKIQDDAAQKLCPPPQWPPQFILGIKGHKYPVAWPETH